MRENAALEPDKTEMIDIAEAIRLVERETAAIGTESVALVDSVGRVLAEPIIADTDMPPFDRSQMDGFAVRSSDTSNPPCELKIVGESVAGRGWHGRPLAAGEAVRIMTGAPLPTGADAVQMLELASLKQDASGELVTFPEAVKPGKHVIAKGAESTADEQIFPAGETITSQMIAAMAAFGYDRVTVGRKPRVAVLSTGSEIVPVGSTPGNDQIRNSNSPMLAVLACRAGGETQEMPLVPDDLDSLKTSIAEAAYKNDILIISGGVSVGKYDLTKDALRQIGAEIFFHRIRLKPGKPAVFARLGSTIVFGLPGNPVSTAVTFHLFVRLALLRMQGASSPSLSRGFAIALKKFKGVADRDAFIPAAVSTDANGRATATPLKWLGSSDFTGFAHADSLVFVPVGTTFEPGDVVQTHRL